MQVNKTPIRILSWCSIFLLSIIKALVAINPSHPAQLALTAHTLLATRAAQKFYPS